MGAEHVLDGAALAHQAESEQVAEPDHAPAPWAYGEGVDGWDLYIVTYPPTNGYMSGFEDDGFDWSWDWDLDDLDFKPDSTVVDTAEESEDESPTQADTEEDARRETGDEVSDRPRSFARARTRTRSRSRRRSGRYK
jgi:hypothetical protein